jgi:hypothetical protein
VVNFPKYGGQMWWPLSTMHPLMWWPLLTMHPLMWWPLLTMHPLMWWPWTPNYASSNVVRLVLVPLVSTGQSYFPLSVLGPHASTGSRVQVSPGSNGYAVLDPLVSTG